MSSDALARRSKRSPRIELLAERVLLSALSVRLTTDKPVYQAGNPIAIRLTETNTSRHSVSVPVDPTDFTTTGAGNFVWQSNPVNASSPATTQKLKPGQSVTQAATWTATQPGNYGLSYENGDSGADGSVQVVLASGTIP